MRALRHLLLAGVILALEFVTLEAALRFHGGSEASPGFQSLFMSDPRIGHRLRPGARTRYTTVEFSTDLAINDQGVRDDAPIGPKAPDERRVVILGDSLVMAVQVPFVETFAKRLEKRLQQAGPAHRWRVINAGVQGYGPVEDWLFYDHVAAAFDPDVVLTVLFVGNDAVEANDNEAKMDARGAPVRADVSDQAATWARRLVRSSMVLQLARVRADQLTARVAGPGGERPLVSYLAEPAPEVVHGLDVTRRAVGYIAAKATAAGARTMLVLMPARFQTDDADYGRLAAIVHENGETLVRQAATERFRDGLASLSLPTLDLLPVLEAQPERAGLFFQRNVHLTPRGHEVVAGALADFLVRTNAVGAAR